MLQEKGQDKVECNILVPGNKQRLLVCFKTLIQERITSVIKSQKLISLIFDGTTDVSKLEACAVIFRFVEVDANYMPVIKERLLDVFTTGNTTADNLESRIVDIFQQWNFEWNWLVSQSYDGASNMRGAVNGLQQKIGSRAPNAIYNWCYAHRLNLVIEGLISSALRFVMLWVSLSSFMYFSTATNGMKCC
jgi:hypothetical protein